jgi:hypothetical protein
MPAAIHLAGYSVRCTNRGSQGSADKTDTVRLIFHNALVPVLLYFNRRKPTPLSVTIENFPVTIMMRMMRVVEFVVAAAVIFRLTGVNQ